MTERTLAMRQKMEAFTDAGLYEQDPSVALWVISSSPLTDSA